MLIELQLFVFVSAVCCTTLPRLNLCTETLHVIFLWRHVMCRWHVCSHCRYLVQEFCDAGALSTALDQRYFHSANGLPYLELVLTILQVRSRRASKPFMLRVIVSLRRIKELHVIADQMGLPHQQYASWAWPPLLRVCWPHGHTRYPHTHRTLPGACATSTPSQSSMVTLHPQIFCLSTTQADPGR